MGLRKGENARYDVLCTRVTAVEYDRVAYFARSRKICITAAVRMLIATGIALLEGEE